MLGQRSDDTRREIRRTVAKTLVALVGMCVFAFALVPLYDVFCQVTGLNGKTSNQAQALAHEAVDQDRGVHGLIVAPVGAGVLPLPGIELRAPPR